MTPEQTIYDALKADAGVLAIVGVDEDGGTVPARIYPDFLQADIVLPAIVYQRSGTEYTETLAATIEGKAAAMQVWCLASTRIAVEALADAAEAALIAAKLPPNNRFTEFDIETETFISVIACDLWH